MQSSRLPLLLTLVAAVAALTVARPRAEAAPAPASAPTTAAAAPAAPPAPAPELAPPSVPHEAELAAEEGRPLVEEDLVPTQVLVRRGPFSLELGALIQVQGAFYVGDDASIRQFDPADTEGFRIRRARFGLAGTILRDVRYYLAIDLKDTVLAAVGGDLGSEILDAKIEWTRFQFARVAAGLMKVPLSSFNLQSSSRLTLIERPLISTVLAPEYRVGVRVEGSWRGLQYAAGVFNGSEGITSGNRLGGVAGVGRLQYWLFEQPERFVPDRFNLALGGAYMIEDARDLLFHRVSGNLEARLPRTRLQAEFLWQDSRPHAEPAELTEAGEVRRWGVAGEASVFLYRELLQLAARYEYFKDSDKVDTFGKQQLFTVGANLYLYRDNFKLQVDYIRRDELSGPEVANDIGFAQLQAMF